MPTNDNHNRISATMALHLGSMDDAPPAVTHHSVGQHSWLNIQHHGDANIGITIHYDTIGQLSALLDAIAEAAGLGSIAGYDSFETPAWQVARASASRLLSMP